MIHQQLMAVCVRGNDAEGADGSQIASGRKCCPSPLVLSRREVLAADDVPERAEATERAIRERLAGRAATPAGHDACGSATKSVALNAYALARYARDAYSP